MSTEDGWGDGEANRDGAGVKALVPHRDREIGRAEGKRARKMNGVSPAELMRCRKRTGGPPDSRDKYYQRVGSRKCWRFFQASTVSVVCGCGRWN